MITIGILTFFNANNYGAVLQTYALTRYLNEIEDVNAVVLNYKSPIIEENKYSRRYYNKYHNIAGYAFSLLNRRRFQKRNLIFDEFRKKYLCIDENKYTQDNIKQLNNLYDGFLVGSDQVWNSNLTGEDTTFYLDFVEDKRKKFSYAASIGEKSAVTEKSANLVNDFTLVSVREKQAAEWLHRFTNRRINVNIDPVFLLSAQRWRECAQSMPKDTRYILYFVNGKCSPESDRFVKNLASENGIPVYYMANEDRAYRYVFYKHLYEKSPIDFINLIDNAEYIVTDSFHVICFSIILHKNFYYDTKGNYNSRVLDLLDELGLNDQIAGSKKRIDSGRRHIVDKKLADLRKSADDYLREVIERIRENEK